MSNLFEQLLAEAEANTFVGGDATPADPRDALVGKPFIITLWEPATSKYGREYGTVGYVLEDGTQGSFTDGSSGVFKQVNAIIAAGGSVTNMLVPKGLSRSDYYRNDVTGQIVKNLRSLGVGDEKAFVKRSTYYLTD